MAYDEILAQRIRRSLGMMKIKTEEKKMFGGICFMINGSMAAGIVKDDLMLRTTDAEYDAALKHPHARVMDFTKKPMRGFLYVDPAGVKSDLQLEKWLQFGIDFAMSDEAAAKKKKKTKKK